MQTDIKVNGETLLSDKLTLVQVNRLRLIIELFRGE